MGGEPDGAKQEYHAKEKFRPDGRSTLRGGLNGGDVKGGLHQDEHRAETHRYDQDSGKNGSKNHLHKAGWASGITQARITQLAGLRLWRDEAGRQSCNHTGWPLSAQAGPVVRHQNRIAGI
jgi:hypothetical protein